MKKVTLFLKLSIDMAVQSQAASVHALTRQLYILQCVSKNHSFTSYPAPKHQNIAYEKTVFYDGWQQVKLEHSYQLLLCLNTVLEIF